MTHAQGAATYELITDVGKVRLLISDTDIENAIFSNDELQVFLDQNGGPDSADLYSAAADAVLALLADRARLAKVVAIGDYSESTVSVGLQLRQLAKDLRERAESIPAEAIAETAWDPFSRAAKLVNDRLRGAL